MTTADERMIELIALLKRTKRIKNRQAFLDAIGMLKQNYREVTTGRRSFKIEHITAACKYYRVNANWILGLEEEVFVNREPTLQ